MVNSEEDLNKLQKKAQNYNIVFFVFVVVFIAFQVPLFDLGIDWSIDSRKPLAIVLFVLLIIFGLLTVLCGVLSIITQRKIRKLKGNTKDSDSQNNTIV